LELSASSLVPVPSKDVETTAEVSCCSKKIIGSCIRQDEHSERARAPQRHWATKPWTSELLICLVSLLAKEARTK
jgi:hypothetical protein